VATATTTVATRLVISASRTIPLSRTDVFIVVAVLSGVVDRDSRLGRRATSFHEGDPLGTNQVRVVNAALVDGGIGRGLVGSGHGCALGGRTFRPPVVKTEWGASPLVEAARAGVERVVLRFAALARQ
jgi:hypothetical protein